MENINRLDKAPNLPVSTATVVVTVVNENEAPRFKENPIKIVVPESVVPGTILKQDIALDPDNSELRYESAAQEEYFFMFLRRQVYVCVCECVAVTFPPLSCASGMKLAEILRGGWTSTEILETLSPRKALTCDLHMLKTISTMLWSRLQVSVLKKKNTEINLNEVKCFNLCVTELVVVVKFVIK